jgi:ribosomal-protein-alanine N-acetyltransferase
MVPEMTAAFPIEPADRAEVAEIRDQLRRDGRIWEDVDLERSRFLVCREAGRRVGWVGLEIDGETGLLRSLFTDPGWRKRGIGRELVAAAEREAAREGVTVVVLFSTGAGGFFRSLGYEEIPVHDAMAAVQGTPQGLWYRARPRLLAEEVTYRKRLGAASEAAPAVEPTFARGAAETGATLDTLETPRLRLRPLALGDLDRLARIWTDPDVSRFLLSRPRDRGEVEARLHAMLEHARRWGMWGIELRATGDLIGRCGFYPYTGDGAQAGGPEPELAFLLARERWGQGLATEAARAVLAALFAMHRPERAIALVDPRHVACRRVLEKIGMRAERRVVVAGAEAVLYATGASPGA